MTVEMLFDQIRTADREGGVRYRMIVADKVAR